MPSIWRSESTRSTGLALERRDRGLGAVDALEIDAIAERVAHLLAGEPAVVDTQDASLGIR